MNCRYSIKGSIRKTVEFVALAPLMGGDIHYKRWPERETFLTTRDKPVTKRNGGRR